MILSFFSKSGGGSRILTSADLANYLGGGSQSAAGIPVSPLRALQLAAVQASVKVLAESVGQLPCVLHKRQGMASELATAHTLWPLLTVAPSEYWTAQEFWEFIVACLALRGNAFARIVRRTKRGAVIELKPLHPGCVEFLWDVWRQTGEMEYRITNADGSQETLTSWEIFHVKLFSVDGVLGLNPVAFARNAIGLGIATEQHGSSLFANGAAPGGVLEYGKPLSEEARLKVVKNWNEQHQGVDNSNKVGVLQDGMQWKSIQMSSTDSQFLETRRYQRSEIAGLFRVPPHMIGDLDRATFANIEQQSLDFVMGGLMPYLTRIQQRIALQLLAPEERGIYFAKFDESQLLRGDQVSQGVADTHDIQNGVHCPNEIRTKRGLNPYPGGERFLVPMNMSVISGPPLPVTQPPAAKP